jgi:hypothetical protein
VSPLDQFFHAFNFAAPAVALALLLPVCARFLIRRSGFTLSLWVQQAIHLIVGVLVLGAGLWYFGRDGKMATYAALLVASASVQWFISAAWRR